MNEEQVKMTALLKAGIRKAAAEIVIQEIMLGVFNSYDYRDGDQIEAIFDTDEIETIHKLFIIEYTEALKNFLSLGDQERDRILNEYIKHKTIMKW